LLFYIANRLMQLIIILFVVSFISFLLFNYLGDPAAGMLRPGASTEDLKELNKQLGLDKPFFVQYVHFLNNILHGKFGYSLQSNIPVIDIFKNRIPATLELVIPSVILSLLFGIPIGIYTAIHPKQVFSKFLQLFSLIGISIPIFVSAILLIFIFSVKLRIFPAYGRGEVVEIGSWWTTGFLTYSGLKALVLPVLSLTIVQLTGVVRIVRAEMTEIMNSDYIKFARAMGYPAHRIQYHIAFRNCLIPLVTIVGLTIAGLLVGSVLTEFIFQWPGIGAAVLTSIAFSAFPLTTDAGRISVSLLGAGYQLALNTEGLIFSLHFYLIFDAA